MSKKNRFKNRRAAPRVFVDQKVEHAPKHIPEITANNYNMISDFTWLFAIIFFYTGIVVALYYYDNQTHVLSSLTDKILSVL